jgi:hypothetical protein
MPRRSSSRRRESELERAVMAALLLPVIVWVFVPALRPLMLIGGGALIFGGIAWLIYRYNQRQTQAEADFLRKLSGAPSASTSVPSTPARARYVTRKSLLSKAEITFHKVLLEALPEAPIFPKVRVADVMDAAERWSGDFLRISQKHFDWVLCHPVSFEPLIAIELDDSSHQWSEKQRKNDQVKDDAAREAGIALLRFPWQREYDATQIRDRIAQVLDRIADAKEAQT